MNLKLKIILLFTVLILTACNKVEAPSTKNSTLKSNTPAQNNVSKEDASNTGNNTRDKKITTDNSKIKDIKNKKDILNGKIIEKDDRTYI